MALNYQIEPRSQRVCVHYEVHPTFAQWAEVMRAIFEDPMFRDGYDFIFDKRHVEAPESDYVEAVVNFYHTHRARLGSCAIVVNGLLSFGMSRMAAAQCDPDDRVRAFTDLAQAEAWLAEERRAHRRDAA